MSVEIRDNRTGTTLTVPKMMWEKVYKKNKNFELLTDNICEAIKPTVPVAIDEVTDHINKIKVEQTEKIEQHPETHNTEVDEPAQEPVEKKTVKKTGAGRPAKTGGKK